MDDKSADMENTIHCVEVRQSFKNSRSFYYSYLARSWCKTIFGLILFFILTYYGIPCIWADELIHCNMHDVWYQCSGIPHQFYLAVLFMALALLLIYLSSTFFTLWWLGLPCLGQLSKLMTAYRRELHNRGE